MRRRLTNWRARFSAAAVAAALAIALCLALPSIAAACPTCGESLAQHDPAHGDLAKGFFWSILFMMGMPPAILGVFCGGMYLSVRRARARVAVREKQGADAESQPGESSEPRS